MSLLPIHIIAGLLGLASGAVALYAIKGGKLHRKSGIIFAYTMLVMSASGALMAALEPDRITMMVGLLTFYLVTTALLTIRRPVQKGHWIDASALILAMTVGIFSLKFGFEALNSPTGTLDGLPAAPAFMFGAVALLAALGDIRVMLAGGIQGAHRIARHLWRMCFALFIAALSFFLGQAEVFPEPIRITPLLAIPVVLVLLLMLYWLARVLLMQRYPRRAS